MGRLWASLSLGAHARVDVVHGPSRFMQDTSFGLRFSFFRSGQATPESRAALRARLADLVDRQRARLSYEIVRLGCTSEASVLLSMLLLALQPGVRTSVCPCLSCGGAGLQIYPECGSRNVPYHLAAARTCHACELVVLGNMIPRCMWCTHVRCDRGLLSSYYSEREV